MLKWIVCIGLNGVIYMEVNMRGEVVETASWSISNL